MKLQKLMSSINIIDTNVDFDCDINKIASDSRKLEKNDVFVALRGEHVDGNLFINEAIKRNVKAIITDKKEVPKNIPYILVDNARSTLSRMWSNYYDNPTKEMKILSITGTNGKSTTAELLYGILKSADLPRGLISTIRCLINDEKFSHGGGSEMSSVYSAMTTPDPEVLYYILFRMKEKGVKYVVLETSSHSLKQSKLDGLNVNVGAFTNLSHEHLDFHKSIEDYYKSKELLLKKSEICVINTDDLYGKLLYDTYKHKSFSISSNANADFIIKEDCCGNKCLKFEITNKDGSITLCSRLQGKYNMYNIAMASSIAKILGISDENIADGIWKTSSIKGRMEKYKNKNIYIDYAHTPYATKCVLEALKDAENDKKIIALVGCGGERDKEKRREIGEICSNLADVLIITSDNPRGEEPLSIIKDILKGVEKNKTHYIIPSRREAILYACEMLDENSVLILLGKGHENYEINNLGKHYFNERDILDEAFKNEKN